MSPPPQDRSLCCTAEQTDALLIDLNRILPPPRLYVNWRFMRGIEAQFLALQKGFTELIPQHLLKPFDHKELEVNPRGGDRDERRPGSFN